MGLLANALIHMRSTNYGGSGAWLDESGNGHDAALVGSPSFNNGYFTLNGSSTAFRITTAAAIDFDETESYTSIAVVRPTSSVANQVVFSKWSSVSGARWSVFEHTTSEQMQAFFSDGTTNRSATRAGALTVGDIEVVALRVDRATDNMYGYGAGASSSAVDISTVGSPATGTDLYLGVRGFDGNAAWFNGDYFGYALFGSLLSDAQIQQVGYELVFGVPTAENLVRSPRYGITRSHTR